MLELEWLRRNKKRCSSQKKKNEICLKGFREAPTHASYSKGI